MLSVIRGGRVVDPTASRDSVGDVGDPEVVVHVTGKAQRVPAGEAVPVGQPFTSLRSVDAATMVTSPVITAGGAENPPSRGGGVTVVFGE